MDDVEEIKSKRLCTHCIGDDFLKAEVTDSGQDGVCDYCGETAKTETIGALAGRFDAIFEEHYERAGDLTWDTGSGDAVEFIVSEAGQIDEAPAKDIQTVMADDHLDWELAQMGESSEYADHLSYAESSVGSPEYDEAFDALEKDLQTRHRFFNRQAEDLFGRIFADLHAQTTWEGRPIIRTIGPGTDLPSLSRGRAFPSEDRFDEAMIDPERWIGTPATIYATPGRMNPDGVAFFYGATTKDLALAEVRPPVGSKVIVGRFDLQQQLQVLDVEALESVLERGSLFDPAFSKRLARAKFLGRLARRIRMPVLPDDERKDYLITQVMAEYLATRVSPRLHGVIYGSAQGTPDAFNVALFHDWSRVRQAEGTPGETHEVSWSGNEEEIDTCVVTTTDPPPPVPGPKSPFIFTPPLPVDEDLRPETLVLDRDSMEVHVVQTVKIKTRELMIHRHTLSDKSGWI